MIMACICHCTDKYPKIVMRVFAWGNKQLFIKLCEQHCNDPDFSNFVSETPINQEMIQK